MRLSTVPGLGGPLTALAALVAVGALLAGCTFVDTVDKRADYMNESVTRFRNQTILRNIIRSAHDEPLSFAALSSVVGHNTSVNQYPSFPAFNWNTWTNAVTGGQQVNSQYNVSSDFTLNAIDDSSTHAAILAPLDASTIAVFTQRSGWQSNFLYLLFFERIRIADPQGRVLATFYGNSIPNEDIRDKSLKQVCAGDLCGSRNMVAYALLAYLNLQFNVEKGSLPGQTKKPRTQICFERDRSPTGRWRDIGFSESGGRIALPARKGGGVPDSYCDQPGTWLPPEGLEGAGSSGRGTGRSPDSKSDDGKSAAAQYVVFDARNNVWVELSTRSTWGIYQFLGSLADRQIERKLPPVSLIQPHYPDPQELIILNIVKGHTGSDCFVDVENGEAYCVPNGPASRLTRVSFAILGQLAALQRGVVSTPSSSSSVRITQ